MRQECAVGDTKSHKHLEHTQRPLNDPEGNFKQVSFNKHYTFLKTMYLVLNYKIRSKQNNHRW